MTCGKPDIRSATVIVIEKNGEYLSRKELLTGRTVWDRHLSNAWTTRDRETAAAMAEKYGGRRMLFNPIIWEVRLL